MSTEKTKAYMVNTALLLVAQDADNEQLEDELTDRLEAIWHSCSPEERAIIDDGVRVLVLDWKPNKE